MVEDKWKKTMPTMSHIEEEISNMLDIPDDELSDEQRATMDAYLDELGDQEASKVDGFAAFIRQEAARADYLSNESKRLASRARAAIAKIDRMKARYLYIMQKHGLKKIRGEVYTLSVRSTKVVNVTPDAIAKLDDCYIRRIPETIEPDKRRIMDALKNGVDVPGCSLGTSENLQIR